MYEIYQFTHIDFIYEENKKCVLLCYESSISVTPMEKVMIYLRRNQQETRSTIIVKPRN